MYFGFQNMRIAYGNRTILENFTMDVPKGKVVSLIGQNGCGKSSLLKTISKAVTQKEGTVYFDDKNIKTYSPKVLARKIAYLAQVHTSPPDIDVRTLVSYGRYPYSKFGRGMTDADKKIIDKAIELTGLTQLQRKALATLSGGERQRAWIAMTVAQEPQILILDEPTTYLDIGYQIEVLELVRYLNEKLGITILMVLHDLNLAARYSDLLYVIKDGSLFATGTPLEILNENNLRDVFLVDANVMHDDIHNCPFFIPNKSMKTKEYHP